MRIDRSVAHGDALFGASFLPRMPRGLLAHWGERGAACPRGRAAIGAKAFSFPEEVGRIARRERVVMPKGKGFDAHQEGQALRWFG